MAAATVRVSPDVAICPRTLATHGAAQHLAMGYTCLAFNAGNAYIAVIRMDKRLDDHFDDPQC